MSKNETRMKMQLFNSRYSLQQPDIKGVNQNNGALQGSRVPKNMPECTTMPWNDSTLTPNWWLYSNNLQSGTTIHLCLSGISEPISLSCWN